MRILFFSLDSPGFLFPAVGLALRARDLGHDVAFVTGPSNRNLLDRLGLQFVNSGGKESATAFQIGHWANPLVAAVQVKRVEAAAQGFVPDLIMSHMLGTGPLIASERLGLPIAQIGFCTYLWPTERQPSTGSDRERRLLWRLQDMLGHFNTARRLMRLSDCPLDGPNPFLGDLFMVRSVPELEPASLLLPLRARLSGACIWNGPPTSETEQAEEWADQVLSEGRTILYVEPGRVFEKSSFWPTFVEALSESSFAVAASVGRYDGSDAKTPAHWLVRPHVPQSVVLPHARAFIGNGTSTGALGAITHGLPSLFVPTGGEQFEVAEVFRRAGVARTMDADGLTASLVASAVGDLIADKWMVQAAQRMAGHFSKVDGPTVALALCEDLVGRGPARTVVEAPGNCVGGLGTA